MPGASFGMIMRQARGPFNRLFVKQDAALLDMAEDIMHAVLFLDHDAEKGVEQRYYVKLDGDEGGTPGEKVYLSASRLSTRPQLSVLSNPETLAEQQERETSAWDKYLKGAIDWNDYLKAIGVKDVEAHNKKLDLDIQRRELKPMFTNARVNLALQISADLLDMDPSYLLTNPLGLQPPPTGLEPPPPAEGGGNTAPAAIGRLSMGNRGQAQGG